MTFENFKTTIEMMRANLPIWTGEPCDTAIRIWGVFKTTDGDVPVLMSPERTSLVFEIRENDITVDNGVGKPIGLTPIIVGGFALFVINRIPEGPTKKEESENWEM